MRKKYEVPAVSVVELLHNEDLLLTISGTITDQSEIRSSHKGWDCNDWSAEDEEE